MRATTESVERAHAPKSAPGPAGTTGPAEVDWSTAQPGARVQVEGVRGGAVLVELPDRRGRVVVRVGGARVTIPVSRVSGLEPTRVDVAQRGPSREPDRGAALGDHSPVLECDLRGLRVDEALDRAQHHIDRALGTGRAVRLIHGHGTGALRGAVRAWLRDVPYVTDFKPGGESEGGNGVTIATLSH